MHLHVPLVCLDSYDLATWDFKGTSILIQNQGKIFLIMMFDCTMLTLSIFSVSQIQY